MLHLKQTKLDKTKKRVSINIKTLLRCRACQTLTNSALNQISNIRSTFGANIPFPKVGLKILNIRISNLPMLSLCMAILILMYILKGLPEALTFFYSEISSIKQCQVTQREVLLSHRHKQ